MTRRGFHLHRPSQPAPSLPPPSSPPPPLQPPPSLPSLSPPPLTSSSLPSSRWVRPTRGWQACCLPRPTSHLQTVLSARPHSRSSRLRCCGQRGSWTRCSTRPSPPIPAQPPPSQAPSAPRAPWQLFPPACRTPSSSPSSPLRTSMPHLATTPPLSPPLQPWRLWRRPSSPPRPPRPCLAARQCHRRPWTQALWSARRAQAFWSARWRHRWQSPWERRHT